MASGHIRKREHKNGHSWQIIIEAEIDQLTGKRNRIYKTIKGTKKQAEKVMVQMLSEMNQGIFIHESTKTLEQFLLEWLDTYIRPTKSPTTTKRYVEQVEKYIIPALGKKKLQDLKSMDIQKFYNALAEKSPLSDKPLSAKSIKNIHMNFLGALGQAVKMDLIKKNPAKHVEVPKTKKYQAEVYTPEEVQTLLENVIDTDMEVPIALLVGLGLRRGEVLALRWQDVDLERGKVCIRRNMVKVGKEIIFKDPKTETSNREIELPSTLLKLLQVERKRYLTNKLKMGEQFEDNDLVVCWDDGKCINPDTLSQKFRRLIERIGLKHIRLHDLRHTNATLMLEYGVNIKVAQQRLGHASISTTMDIYSHVTEKVEKEAADKLDKGIFEALDIGIG